MSNLSRSVSLAVLALSLGAAGLQAQQQDDQFTWAIGPQAGVIIFGTQAESRGALATAGGQVFIKARRAGLILSVDEGFGKTRQSSFLVNTTPTAETSTVVPVNVTFKDVRRYAATIVAFPFKPAPVRPYVGVGLGILQVVNPQVAGFGPDQTSDYEQRADQISGATFASLLGGIQFKLGGLSLFGQYQLTTRPGVREYRAPDSPTGTFLAQGRLINTATHSFMGGLRISLGSSRDELGRTR